MSVACMMENDCTTWILIFSLTLYIIKQAMLGAYYVGGKDLLNKTVIVTGANSGIGYQTALNLAKRNANVILACRDAKRGREAVGLIKQKSGNAKVRFCKLDLACFKSVYEFVSVIKKEERSIYSLVNNAGIFWCPYTLTKNNIEANFGVNYLGHFLLTLLLLPLLNNEKYGSRIINVTSSVHIFGKSDFLADINYKRKEYDFAIAYSNSKLANVLFTKTLANKLKTRNIKTCCVDPGIIYTNIGRYSSFMSSFFYTVLSKPITWLFFKDADAGSQTAVYCVCSDEVGCLNGQYFCECEHRYPWRAGLNESLAEELWKKSLRLTGVDRNELNLLKDV